MRLRPQGNVTGSTEVDQGPWLRFKLRWEVEVLVRRAWGQNLPTQTESKVAKASPQEYSSWQLKSPFLRKPS